LKAYAGKVRCAICGLLANFALSLPAFAGGRHEPVEPQTESNFRASSDLVLINATVLDGRGRVLTGMDADRFHLLEGGVEQKLAAFNLNSAVPLSARPDRPLYVTTSNCGADHLLGEKCLVCMPLRPQGIAAGTGNCRI
jgi:hypothetical protein